MFALEYTNTQVKGQKSIRVVAKKLYDFDF